MNSKKLVFEQIHMGRRLQHFVSMAPHGKGSLAIAKLLDVGKTTIYNVYERPTLDMIQVEKVCDFYGITVFEFLGIEPQKMPDSFMIKAEKKVPEFETINLKLDKIISQIEKVSVNTSNKNN